MRSLSVIKKFYLYILLGILLFGGATAVSAQVDGGIGVSAARIETIIPAGSEKTVGMVVDYTRDFPEAKLPTARLVARLEDWTIKPNGEIKFAPVSTLERSAAAWVTYGPAEFNLVADTRQVMRFTISVPKNTPPGDYLVACYFEGRDTPPPTDGNRQLYVKFRYYTMIYVMVPGLTTGGELQALEAKNVDGTLFVIPKLANTGNSRLRPKHSVEIRDRNDKAVFSSAPSDAMVVLGGRSWQMPYPLTTDLPLGDYKLVYNVDFGDKKAIHVGKTNFSITEADIAARRKKLEAATTAQNKATETKATETKPADSIPADVKKADTKAAEISAAAVSDKTVVPPVNKPPQ